MKRKGISILIMPICTILIIFACGYLIRFYLQKTSSELILRLETVEQYADQNNWDAAYSEMKSVDSLWERREKVWGMFINHHETDNISISLKSSLVYINKEDSVESLSSLSALRYYISHIPVIERISLKNIL